jgi:hypothetical protein
VVVDDVPLRHCVRKHFTAKISDGIHDGKSRFAFQNRLQNQQVTTLVNNRVGVGGALKAKVI